MNRDSSWGRLPGADQHSVPLAWKHEPLPALASGTQLPHGLGRSYGDSCLNDGGRLLETRALDRFIAFDRERGVLRCEAGVSLEAILALVVPAGWFLPVTPGTKYVTVGGAIANDVHGKNHHAAGTFGRHVTAFEILRSDGKRLVCSAGENANWFGATIGGLGLTGLVTWAELRLLKIPGPGIAVESIRFGSVDEFFQINDESEKSHPYTVSWIDLNGKGAALGRGHYIRGDFTAEPPKGGRTKALARLPLDLPSFSVNPLTVWAFNVLYYGRQQRRLARAVSHYEPFFYPLDVLEDWNRGYGPQGFFQYQCVMPRANRDAVKELLGAIARSGQAAPVNVFKSFGALESPGWLSFPHDGYTYALDFPNRGAQTLALFERLDRIVEEAGGRLYPAKDARMSAEHFQRAYPKWKEFAKYVDPTFSSGFWRRVSGS